MVLLILLAEGFFFLVVGAFVFTAFGATPRLQKYALSAALWWAVWGPCVIALQMLAGLSIAANGLAQHGWGGHWNAPPLPGWKAYGWIGLLGTVGCATVVARVHQSVIHRMTLALFRLYAAAVAAAVGSTLGLALWLLLASEGWGLWGGVAGLSGMVILTGCFGVLGFRGARKLRGTAPKRLTWLSREEFEGV